MDTETMVAVLDMLQSWDSSELEQVAMRCNILLAQRKRQRNASESEAEQRQVSNG